MKVLAAVVAVATAVVVALVAFALLNLRTLIGAHQDELVARVTRAVGRPVTVGAVVPSWWPLGVRLRDVSVGEDAAFGSEPFLVAAGVVIGIRPWPLVSGRIEASGIHLDLPRLSLVRDDGGRWNVESLGESSASGTAETSAPKERRRGFRVPLEWVVGVALSQVDDGTIVVDDRRAHWPAPLVLRHVGLRATDVRLGATAHVHLEAALFAAAAPDLEVDLQVAELGQHDAEHAPFTAHVELADADLGVLAGWLGRSDAAAGRMRRLTVEAEGSLTELQASLDLDAVDSALAVGGMPLGRAQPIGVRAVVRRTNDALTIDELRATFGTLAVDARGEAQLDPWRVALTLASSAHGAATVALDHGTLAVGGLEGRVTIDRDGMALAPLQLRVDEAPITLRGWITDTDPPAFDLHVEGRPFDGTVTADVAVDASGAARARVDVAAIDLAAALPRFAPDLERRIEGRASGAAVLTARVAKRRLSADSLEGDGTLTVQDGRLRAVNLPDLVVEQIERVPLMPQIVSARTRARYGELFASRDTVIDSADVPFTIARGRFTSDRAVLVNPAYQISGKGWIDQAEALRFTGTVVLGASVSRTLRDDVAAAKYLAADDGRITLPFVARGRLGAVKVEPDSKRLRERGLTALLGSLPDAVGSAPDHHRRDDRPRDDDLEDRVIERLERMLKP
jgi:hypothetical protein